MANLMSLSVEYPLVLHFGSCAEIDFCEYNCGPVSLGGYYFLSDLPMMTRLRYNLMWHRLPQQQQSMTPYQQKNLSVSCRLEAFLLLWQTHPLLGLLRKTWLVVD
jgi:hypothetical protein